MSKRLFIDVETTGRDHEKHAVIQISGLVEVDWKIVTDFNFRIKPFPGDEIEDAALEVNGISREQLARYPEPDHVYNQLINILERHVSPYNNRENFVFFGFHADFDWKMMDAWFRKVLRNFLQQYCFWPPQDVANIASWIVQRRRHELKNFKLKTVAEYIGIDIDESRLHDALYDIELTYQIEAWCTQQLKEVA